MIQKQAEIRRPYRGITELISVKPYREIFPSDNFPAPDGPRSPDTIRRSGPLLAGEAMGKRQGDGRGSVGFKGSDGR